MLCLYLWFKNVKTENIPRQKKMTHYVISFNSNLDNQPGRLKDAGCSKLGCKKHISQHNILIRFIILVLQYCVLIWCHILQVNRDFAVIEKIVAKAQVKAGGAQVHCILLQCLGS